MPAQHRADLTDGASGTGFQDHCGVPEGQRQKAICEVCRTFVALCRELDLLSEASVDRSRTPHARRHRAGSDADRPCRGVHKAKVTVYVPVYAMSGGTLIASLLTRSCWVSFPLGPIDPQIAGLPAASIVKARDSKPTESVFDLTLVLADVAEKALAQVKQGAVELLTPRMEQAAAEALAAKLAGGHWTHDYALTAHEALSLGLPVKVGMPLEVMQLMTLYPQPIQQSGVEFLPIDIPRQRRV